MQVTAPESVPARSIRRRKRAPECRARNRSWNPSAERTCQSRGWTPRLATDDWPRRCSRTACASLGASCPAPVRVCRFADCSARDENRLAPFGHLRGVVGLRVGRESAVAYVGAILAHRIRDNFSDIGILARKFRRVVECKTQKIINDEDLPVAVRAGTDADRRNAQFARNLRPAHEAQPLEQPRKHPPPPPPAHRESTAPRYLLSCPARDIRQVHSPIAVSVRHDP